MKPEVETTCGRLAGSVVGGVHVFRGVPFARPPRAGLRFRPPEPPEPWSGVRPGARSGAAPPQMGLPGFRTATLAARRTGEDCLSLNVWTPGLDAARRPVLIWIHGGGFLIGSGATPLYDGRDLARRGELVVVTLNYRLGAFGFLDLAGVFGGDFEGCSNLGLRDQIAALEWVRDNIERFGGDPENVTIFGQSAGGMSIAGLLAAPPARGLFHRAIAQSGAASHYLEREDALRVAHVFLGNLGGPPPDHQVLGRLPVQRILDAQTRTMAQLADLRHMMVFAPCVDGDLIPAQPLEMIRAGAAADAILLVGTTLDEWKLFQLVDRSLFAVDEAELVDRVHHLLAVHRNAPDAASAVVAYRDAVADRGGRTSAREIWNAFQSARVFHFPAAQLAEAHASSGGSTYGYLFTWRPQTLRRSLGACHALELPFLFGFTRHPLARPLIGFDGSAHRLARSMQTAWAGFAHEGRPGSRDLPEWERYEPARRATMVLGRDSYLDDAPLESERRLWQRWTA